MQPQVSLARQPWLTMHQATPCEKTPMRLRLTTLSLCLLALAGCQTTGGIHEPATTAPPATPAAPEPASPWQQARDRGMIFRATGQDPGWSVEVQKSRTPTLFVVLDDSQRHLQVPQATPFSDPKTGTAGFRGSAEDGTPVELLIHRGQCESDMSGKQQDASAELNVGARQYQGCGRFLFQQP